MFFFVEVRRWRLASLSCFFSQLIVLNCGDFGTVSFLAGFPSSESPRELPVNLLPEEEVVRVRDLGALLPRDKLRPSLLLPRTEEPMVFPITALFGRCLAADLDLAVAVRSVRSLKAR